MTNVSCVWIEAGTTNRICLREDAHDCPLRPTRLATRCTRTDAHMCRMGRHLAASRPSRLARVRDAVLGAWIVAWLVGFAAFVGVVG